jgi:hypothetical protein
MPRSRMAAKKRERHVEPPFGPTCPRSSPTSRGTYEHEVREVDAGNEKYERDRAQQQEHSRAHASCHELAQGLDLCDAVREPSRCLGGKRSRDLIHPGLRLLDGHPIAQSTDDVQVAACHVNRAWRATSAPHVSGPKATRSKNSCDLTLDPREDHAAYIADWLHVLKTDNRAIFTAATHAQRAADFINGLQPAASAG